MLALVTRTCDLVGSLSLVRVLVDETVPDVATGVHVPIQQAHKLYTAHCETTAYGVKRLALLARNRLEHLVEFRARLEGVDFAHLLELDPYSATKSHPNTSPLFDSRRTVFAGPGNPPLAHERGGSVRNNYFPLATLEQAPKGGRSQYESAARCNASHPTVQ